MLYSTGNTNSFYSDNYVSSITGNTIGMSIYDVDLLITTASTSVIASNARYGAYSVDLTGITNNGIYSYSLWYLYSAGTMIIETGMINCENKSYSATTANFTGYTRSTNETKFYTR